jgi:hypothetical protein
MYLISSTLLQALRGGTYEVSLQRNNAFSRQQIGVLRRPSDQWESPAELGRDLPQCHYVAALETIHGDAPTLQQNHVVVQWRTGEVRVERRLNRQNAAELMLSVGADLHAPTRDGSERVYVPGKEYANRDPGKDATAPCQRPLAHAARALMAYNASLPTSLPKNARPALEAIAICSYTPLAMSLKYVYG